MLPCRRVHVLSINEDEGEALPANSATSRRSPRGTRVDSGVLCLVAVQLTTYNMVTKKNLASRIRENINTISSMLGGEYIRRWVCKEVSLLGGECRR